MFRVSCYVLWPLLMWLPLLDVSYLKSAADVAVAVAVAPLTRCSISKRLFLISFSGTGRMLYTISLVSFSSAVRLA